MEDNLVESTEQSAQHNTETVVSVPDPLAEAQHITPAPPDEMVSPVATNPQGEMQQIQQNLLDAMVELRQDFDVKIKYDESKEHLINSLHKELQFHREGLHFRILRPMFMDLISLYDELGKLIAVDPPVSASDQQTHHVSMFQEIVLEILQRNGAHAFTVEQELFLSSKQRSLRSIPTSDPAQDRCVATRVRVGFAYEEILLRPELVEIYKYHTPER